MPDLQWSRRSRINGYVESSGTSTPLETSVLDMNGFESVMFIGVSSITSTGKSVAVAAGTASTTGAGNFSDLQGAATAFTSGAAFTDVYRPTKRYVQGRFQTTAATAAARALVAIRYGADSLPTTQDAATTGIQLYAPTSGTSTGAAT